MAFLLYIHIDNYRYDSYTIVTISRTFDDIDTYRYEGGYFMKNVYAEYIPALKAVSDVTRLEIIDMLSCGEMCACDILEYFSISQSTLSYHMKTLVDSGLVNAERDGALMRYTLNKQKVEATLTFLTSITNEKEECICKECIHSKNK